MALAIFFSILAGAFGVWQAGFNKVVADSLGFTASLFFNGLFFLLFNSLFFIFVLWRPQLVPPEFGIQWSFENFKWWWVLPGFMGFALVMGLAVSVGRIGAVQTFTISIAAQIFASILWDAFSSDFEMNRWRVIGASLTLAGAIIATLN